MRYLWGLILAGGLVVGQPESVQAQFSLSIGNPYTGTGLTIGNPYGYGGYGPGYGGYGYNSYSTYDYGYGRGAYGFNSGYYGAPAVVAPVVPSYGYAYPARSFGYSSGYRGLDRGFNNRRYGPTPGFRENWLSRGFRR